MTVVVRMDERRVQIMESEEKSGGICYLLVMTGMDGWIMGVCIGSLVSVETPSHEPKVRASWVFLSSSSTH
uniref:Uncharacterized protein n=1 Tax=Onchocerca volvulus TaxID=6282 RepID=A0A8R1XWL2_ONCVO